MRLSYFESNDEPSGALSAVIIPAPTAYWKLDEASGSRIDSTGNGNNLLITASAVPSAAGLLNNAASFNTDLLKKLERAALDSAGGPVTISVWVKLNSVATDQFIIGRLEDGAGSVNGYGLCFGSTSATFFYTQGDDSIPVDDRLVSVVPVSVGVWYHVMCGYDGSNHFLIVNGGIRETDEGLNPKTAVAPFSIGRSYETFNSLNGLVDEAGVWIGTALSYDQAVKLYNSGTPLAYPLT